jgi:hypothetical protein
VRPTKCARMILEANLSSLIDMPSSQLQPLFRATMQRYYEKGVSGARPIPRNSSGLPSVDVAMEANVPLGICSRRRGILATCLKSFRVRPAVQVSITQGQTTLDRTINLRFDSKSLRSSSSATSFLEADIRKKRKDSGQLNEQWRPCLSKSAAEDVLDDYIAGRNGLPGQELAAP